MLHERTDKWKQTHTTRTIYAPLYIHSYRQRCPMHKCSKHSVIDKHIQNRYFNTHTHTQNTPMSTFTNPKHAYVYTDIMSKHIWSIRKYYAPCAVIFWGFWSITCCLYMCVEIYAHRKQESCTETSVSLSGAELTDDLTCSLFSRKKNLSKFSTLKIFQSKRIF